MPTENHKVFLDRALPLLKQDSRILGVAVAGSWVSGNMDKYSDIDLVIVCFAESYESVLKERLKIAEKLGKLLSGFSGEHVGVPQLFICLYNDPLVHVDLKFVSLGDLGNRIENPTVLWERGGELSKKIFNTQAILPMTDPQWIEDRFWVWIHYVAAHLGRGELFEVLDFLSFLRSKVLGPLLLIKHGGVPLGVRRLETLAPENLSDLRKTVASYDRASCVEAIRTSASLYRHLRDENPSVTLIKRSQAEQASLKYLEEIASEKNLK